MLPLKKDRRELATQVLLEHIRVVQRLDKLVDDVCLLVGEVHQLRDILEIAALLAELVDAALESLYHKTCVLEGLDISIYRAVGGA